MHRQLVVPSIHFQPSQAVSRKYEDLTANPHFIQRLREGHVTAWQQLIEFWSPRLYSYVVYSTHSEVDAQHLLQQAFATVVQSLVESTHVCDLTVIVVSALYRTVARYQQEFGAPSLDAEYLRALVNPGQPRFIDALKQLAPQVRQLLLLRYCVGLTVTELAPITGCSASALSALFRAATQHFQSTALL